jgi:biopolymer transport protein ExbB/TolQ
VNGVELFLKNQIKSKSYVEFFIYGSVGLILINLIFIMLPTFWANLFLGKTQLELSVTFQDIMWVCFIFGFLIIKKRQADLKQMSKYQKNQYLPDNFEDMIDDDVLTDIIISAKADSKDEMGLLPDMILQISLQFRTNNSIALTSDLLSKQLELFLHSVELRYNNLKYIIWLIPSLGFMGTVYGIGLAVSKLGEGSLDDPSLLTTMSANLGIAFNTTLLALILSVILQFFTQRFEAEEESLINGFGKYVMDNLINKIIEK